MSYQFNIKSFDELTTFELFKIYRARIQVYVVEQQAAYQDIDNLDIVCYHTMVTKEGELAGYSRIIPPLDELYKNNESAIETNKPSGINHKKRDKNKLPAIGRVMVLPKYRGQNLARQLMQHTIECCHVHYPNQPIAGSAQAYLTSFYESLGFQIVGESYLLNNIEHIEVQLPP